MTLVSDTHSLLPFLNVNFLHGHQPHSGAHSLYNLESDAGREAACPLRRSGDSRAAVEDAAPPSPVPGELRPHPTSRWLHPTRPPREIHISEIHMSEIQKYSRQNQLRNTGEVRPHSTLLLLKNTLEKYMFEKHRNAVKNSLLEK